MAAKLEVIEAGEKFTHVALRGRLDATGVEAVEAELTKETFGRRKPAIIDITGVDVLVSVGIGMLVKLARSMHSHAIIMGVVATGLSKENLERLKIHTIFPVVATYEEARQTLMLK